VGWPFRGGQPATDNEEKAIVRYGNTTVRAPVMIERGSEHFCFEKATQGAKKSVKQVVFDGEPFTALNLQRMRERLIPYSNASHS